MDILVFMKEKFCKVLMQKYVQFFWFLFWPIWLILILNMHVGGGVDEWETEPPKEVADESGVMGVINLDWDLNTMWESKPF